MSPKPTLNYASRTEAVIALRAIGLSTSAIAAKIGIKPTTVTALECSASRSPARRSHTSDRQQPAGAVELRRGQREALRPFAAKRNLSVGALLVLLIDRITDDKLVDAILDDAGVQYK